MPIEMICAECGRTLRVPDAQAGLQARCPQCKTVFTVPTAASGPSAQSSKPDAWFVNTAAGERFGPISREELDRWVAEDRLTAGCKLIRQGESRSINAADLYPQLGSANPFAEQGEQPAFGPQITTDNPYASPAAGGGQHKRPHRGGMILTFGILGICFTFFTLCCGLSILIGGGFSIAAWAMGNTDLAAIRRGHMDRSGYGTTQAGMILGIIGTILAGLAFVGILCFFLLAFLA